MSIQITPFQLGSSLLSLSLVGLSQGANLGGLDGSAQNNANTQDSTAATKTSTKQAQQSQQTQQIQQTQ